MAWEENSCISLNMQLIAILSRIGVVAYPELRYTFNTHAHICRMLHKNYTVVLIQIEHNRFLRTK